MGGHYREFVDYRELMESRVVHQVGVPGRSAEGLAGFLCLMLSVILVTTHTQNIASII